MENGIPDLPQDIITNILVRLSAVKSLMRFQCVCKDWKNLFRTPSFIAEHLHHSTRQNPLLIVDNDISGGRPWHLCSLNREMQVFKFQNTPIINSSISGCVYSSNGLLCVKLTGNTKDCLWLWNPSIRVVRQVPKSLNYAYEGFSVGFGFSPIINDYKIVKFFLPLVVQAEVYSLRTGLWRKVEVGNLEGIHEFRCKAFPCNGAIFWIGRKEDVRGTAKSWQDIKSWLDLIVSFDIATEVFTLIPFPPMAPYYCYDTLTSYEDKLAIFFGRATENCQSYVIDLWVLEECADPSRERWSWAKIYTSRPNPQLGPNRFILNPRIIWKNEIVGLVLGEGVAKNYEGKVVLRNLTTGELSFFDSSICTRRYIPGILDYVESLMLLDNKNASF